jgi:hypothetical protein
MQPWGQPPQQYPLGPYPLPQEQYSQGQDTQGQYSQQGVGPVYQQQNARPPYQQLAPGSSSVRNPQRGKRRDKIKQQPPLDWWYREPPLNKQPQWVDIVDIENAIKAGRERDVNCFDGVRCLFKTDVITSAMAQGRLFGEERLLPILEQIHNFKPGDTYWLFDVWGNQISDWKYMVPSNLGLQSTVNGGCCIRAVLKYHSIQELAMAISETTPSRNVFPPPVTIEFKPFPSGNCILPPDFRKNIQGWAREWEGSNVRRTLRKFILDNIGNMNDIFEVKCLGLGCFGSFNPGHHWDESALNLIKDSYIQHLFAADVRDWFENRQGITIPIVSQDPLYCHQVINKLKQDFRINVLWDPFAFFRINRHTFVIDFCKVINSRQIIMDNCEPGGPGGMVCKMVAEGDTGLQYHGQSYPYDDVQMRYYWASRGAYEHWGEDPSCPAMYQYSQEALSLALPDEISPFRTRAMYLRRNNTLLAPGARRDDSGKGKARTQRPLGGFSAGSVFQ